MSVDETKRLLRTFRIVPNRLLGQNFMVDPSVFPLLGDYASLQQSDVVLDAGAGFGFLSFFLAKKCRAVIAVEKDPQIARVLHEKLKDLANVTVIEGDVLKATLPEFNKVVAIPPYYLSSRLVVWLLKRRPECTVLVLQKEFADRLVASIGSEEYGWLTVAACHAVEVELFDAVSKAMFYPQPEVESIVVRLRPFKIKPFEVKDEALFEQMVRWLFTQRNKKLSNALAPFLKNAYKMPGEEAERRVCAISFRERRVRELSPKDFGVLANALKD